MVVVVEVELSLWLKVEVENLLEVAGHGGELGLELDHDAGAVAGLVPPLPAPLRPGSQLRHQRQHQHRHHHKCNW